MCQDGKRLFSPRTALDLRFRTHRGRRLPRPQLFRPAWSPPPSWTSCRPPSPRPARSPSPRPSASPRGPSSACRPSGRGCPTPGRGWGHWAHAFPGSRWSPRPEPRGHLLSVLPLRKPRSMTNFNGYQWGLPGSSTNHVCSRGKLWGRCGMVLREKCIKIVFDKPQ